MKEKLAAHEEEGKIMQAISSEEETAEGIVLDYLGYNGISIRNENNTRPHTSSLLSKSRYPLFARSMRNPLTSI
jgi:hypothetical protein